MPFESVPFRTTMLKKFGKKNVQKLEDGIHSYFRDAFTFWTLGCRKDIPPHIILGEEGGDTLAPNMMDPDYAAAFALVQGVAMLLGFDYMGADNDPNSAKSYIRGFEKSYGKQYFDELLARKSKTFMTAYRKQKKACMVAVA